VSIRQAINQRPVLMACTALAIIGAAIGVVWITGSSRDFVAPQSLGNLEFYSDDDGATFFVDDVHELTPFRHEGKDAVRAYVYRCPGTSSFVGYLQRQTEYGRQQRGVAGDTGSRPTIAEPPILEVKKPGDKNWIPVDPKHFTKVLDVMNVLCPGARDSATLVRPAQ
jgi:hypothetical protein